MYFVQGLEHIEKYIRWAEAKYPNIKVEQVPHWTLTYILRSGMFCIRKPKIKLLKLADIEKAIRKKHKIDYVFYGMKKADGMNRRLMLNTYTGYENKGKVFPLANWSQKDVIEYMQLRKIPQPVRYSKNASGGCGFNVECFLWMRENYPQDLQKVLETFPMSEKLLLDYDYKHQTKQA